MKKEIFSIIVFVSCLFCDISTKSQVIAKKSVYNKHHVVKMKPINPNQTIIKLNKVRRNQIWVTGHWKTKKKKEYGFLDIGKHCRMDLYGLKGFGEDNSL